ncbi:MAG: MBL fold metallo-hydrolase [Aquisalimonadaceae bacterium]
MKPLQIGEYRIETIEEVSGPRYRPEWLLPDSSPELIDQHAAWMAPDLYDPATRLLAMIRQTYVVRTPQRTILIDTCVGDHKERASPNFNRLQTPWLENFKSLGLSFEDIDLVMCTHLHVDHVGWNTRLENGRWVPTFPNAKYLFGRTEFNFWTESLKQGPDPDGPIFEDSVLPVVEAGLAEIVDDDYELSTGIWFELTPGHTPGHLCVNIEHGGASAIFSGDLMHHPIQVREPQWNSRFCHDAEAARTMRMSFLDKHADSDRIIIPAHFERGTAGRIQGASDGFHFHFLDGPSTRSRR